MREFKWTFDRDVRVTIDLGRKQVVQFPPDFPFALIPYSFAPPVSTIPNFHDFLEINYVHGGCGVQHIGGKKYAAEQGDVFIVDNQVFHYTDAIDEPGMKMLVMLFMPAFISPEPSPRGADAAYFSAFKRLRNPLDHKVPLDIASRRRIVELFSLVGMEFHDKPPFYQAAVKNHVLDILLIINRAYESEYHDRKTRVSKDNTIEQLQPVFEYIGRNFRDKLSIDTLARIACMSTGYFFRRFKKSVGMTPTEYLVRYRIDHVKKSLAQGNRYIYQSAFDNGFENMSYFNRAFRKYAHQSPREFVRRQAGAEKP